MLCYYTYVLLLAAACVYAGLTPLLPACCFQDELREWLVNNIGSREVLNDFLPRFGDTPTEQVGCYVPSCVLRSTHRLPLPVPTTASAPSSVLTPPVCPQRQLFCLTLRLPLCPPLRLRRSCAPIPPPHFSPSRHLSILVCAHDGHWQLPVSFQFCVSLTAPVACFVQERFIQLWESVESRAAEKGRRRQIEADELVQGGWMGRRLLWRQDMVFPSVLEF